MADMTFAEFLAIQHYKAQFVEPLATRLRALIVERISAALEWAEYGNAGALGQPVLPKFKSDHNSEVGMVSTAWPVLMVIPIETASFTEDFIGLEHQLHVQADVVGKDGNRLTTEAMLYLKAIIHVVLSLKSSDWTAQWPAGSQKPGGIAWDVINHDYGTLRGNKKATMYKRSVSCRVEVKAVEA